MTNHKYSRQTILKDFGYEGQHALSKAKLLVIGAGGLACPLLQYVVAMGVGRIGIVDDDIVSESNLHRQILFGVDDVGKAKVLIAQKKLKALNDEVIVDAYQFRLDQSNCLAVFEDYDIIADCSDNFATRYMVNDACVLLKKPLVYGAVNGFEGQVAVFNVFDASTTTYSGNYRNLYEVMPQEGEVLNCAEAGVLGVLPGIIGSLQASEVIKLICKIGTPLINKLMCYTMMNQQSMTFTYNPSQDHAGPKSISEFLTMKYDLSCDSPPQAFEIDGSTFQRMLSDEKLECIDVREPHELPHITKFKFKRIVFNELGHHYEELATGKIIFICQSGKRSLEAVKQAQRHFNEFRFYSLKGGIVSMNKNVL